jgi:plasmid maintenance system antidote protein VapI
MPENRSCRARISAGLSIGQAAKLLGIERETVKEIEARDELPAQWVDRLAELYGVDPPWLTGERELLDYSVVDGMRGAENITANDRDVIAEFAASMPRKPRSPEANAVIERIRNGRAGAVASCVDEDTKPTVDLVAFDRQLALLEEDAQTGRFGATPELVAKWRAYRARHWPCL